MKLTIQEMQKLAQNKGGRCLSTEYINANTKLFWKCAKEHTWWATPAKIKNRGSWCPSCSGNVPLSLDKMQRLAESAGGKCLSTEYINNNTKLLWQCVNEHRWKAIPSNIQKGSWCPHCYKASGRPNRRKYSIEDMQLIANSRGGRCLSTEFININHNLLWECSEKHQWEADFEGIKLGAWCPECYKVNGRPWRRKYSVKDMQVLAGKRNGRCLSIEYKNTNSKLIWECSQGHQWKSTFSNIMRGTWCPDCSNFKSERICRIVFEHIFGLPFIKCRPDWLRNTRGNRLELDGFCSELGIAFEYQGHYHYKPKTQKSTDIKAYERTKKNDEEKKKKIEKLNKNGGISGRSLKLVIVEKFDDGAKYQDIIRHVVEALTRSDVVIPSFDINIDFSKAYQVDRTEEINNLIESKGGELISGGITSCEQKIQVKCENGHKWWVLPYSIKQGTWCPDCVGNIRHTIEDLHSLAASRKGKCLSIVYINNKNIYEWKCDKGHQWNASYTSVLKGSWCPHCNKNAKLTLVDLQKLAAQRGGECLATEYVNARAKYKWKCFKNHEWEARAYSIKAGTWCPDCSSNNKKE